MDVEAYKKSLVDGFVNQNRKGLWVEKLRLYKLRKEIEASLARLALWNNNLLQELREIQKEFPNLPPGELLNGNNKRN